MQSYEMQIMWLVLAHEIFHFRQKVFDVTLVLQRTCPTKSWR